MTQSPKMALVVCALPGDETSIATTLLGLSIGERLLLALAAAGVESVAFAGPGPRPSSSRAAIENADCAELLGSSPDGADILVLASDLVFDRGLLQRPADQLEHLPLRLVRASEAAEIAASADDWLDRVGQGSASSGAGYAIRVSDRHSAKCAHRALLLSLRKPIDGFVSRHLNRYVSLAVTRLLIRTGIGPNPLTFVFMLLGAASGLFAAFPEHWWSLLVAGLLFQGQSILDGCDGEIARLTYRFSKAGQWLDSVGDDVTNYSFYLGLSIGLSRYHEAEWLLALGVVTFAFQWAASGIQYWQLTKLGTGDLLAIPDHFAAPKSEGAGSAVLGFLRAMVKRDFFVFVVAAFTAAQLPSMGFAVMTAGTYPMFFGVAANCRQNAKQGLLVRRK